MFLMSIRDVKSEARRKLPLNMHQAIVIYTIEFAIIVTVIALIVMAVLCFEHINTVAAICMICYGIIVGLIAVVGSGMIEYSMVDYYIASYKCKPYNIRRLGETLARSGVVKVLQVNLLRTFIGFLLLLCLIVPGVIYLAGTSMANHLLIANPKMKATTALKASRKVMSGKLGLYMGLHATFIGWGLLCVLTLGLGFIFLTPYINLSKTVYYKRNLQGDKAVYNTVPQPVSPIAYVQQGYAVPGTQPQSAAQPQGVNAQPAEPMILPIDALGEEDFADMNEAMRDFGGNAQPIVAEVPLSPVNPSRSAETENVVSVRPEPIVQPEQPAMSDEIGARAVDGSDFVEIVSPLTTREVDAADVLNKKINEMFAPQSAQQKSGLDYMTGGLKSNANDFMTAEVEAAVVAEPVPSPADNIIAAEPAVGESVQSAQLGGFDNFMKDFDIPMQSGAFEPLTRSSKANRDDGMPSNGSVVSQTRKPTEVKNGADIRSSRRADAVTPNYSDAESRRDKIRREREERLNQIRNGKK